MWTRRRFLTTAAGAAGIPGVLLLAGCGDDSDTDGGDAGAPTADGVYDLVRRFPTTVLVPGAQRLPISLGEGGTPLTDGPDELAGRVVDQDGTIVTADLRAVKRIEGLPNPYWSFRTELTELGIYTLLVDGAAPQGAAFQINEPASVLVPLVGAPLPPFDTPTVADGRGVDPICTRLEGTCALHDLTLTEALGAGTPVAYLIGTPAYCQTGVCGPILDLLLELRDEFGDAVTFVHADVYADESLASVAPAVTAYQLDFEPVLFVTDATGTLVERLDAVFDQGEMRAAIEAALGA